MFFHDFHFFITPMATVSGRRCSPQAHAFSSSVLVIFFEELLTHLYAS